VHADRPWSKRRLLKAYLRCARGERSIPDKTAFGTTCTAACTNVHLGAQMFTITNTTRNYFVVALLLVLNSPSRLATSSTPLARLPF
jgi:hypothetical protein